MGIFTTIMTTLLVYLIQIKFKFRKFRVAYYIKIYGTIARAFLATPNPSLPPDFRMRFVLGLWIMGGLFVTIHIQTNFIAVLMKPNVENEIKTQTELLNSDLNVSVGMM